jgi:hypothetical protein
VGVAGARAGLACLPGSESLSAPAHLFACAASFSPTNSPTTKTRPLLAKGENPGPHTIASCTKPLRFSSPPPSAFNAALFSRVYLVVVDCCCHSHSTAPVSNPTRSLSSSSIDRFAIHPLTSNRTVTHPRLSYSAHSNTPLNSKSAHPPSLALLRVAPNLRVAVATTSASGHQSINRPVDSHRSQHHHLVAAINLTRPMRSRVSSSHTLLTTRRAL